MRILHIINALGAGGIEILVRDLTRGLAERGCTVHVACVRQAPEPQMARALAEDFAHAGVEVTVLSPGQSVAPLVAARRLRGLLRDFRPDVVHAHLFWGMFLRRLVLHPVPTVYTHHIDGFPNGTWPFRVFDRVADAYVALTESNREALAAAARRPLEAVTVIPNGVSPARLLEGEPAPKNAGRLRVISVGRLRPQKNYALLVEAAARLFASSPELRKQVEFVILGDGPDAARVAALADAKGLKGLVQLPGAVSNVGAWLRSADIFLMTSDYEGLPIALIEAMSTGLPAVCTAVGACGELVVHGESGLVVPPGDADALAGALATLIADRALRQRFGRAASGRARDYSIDATVEKHLALYRGLSRPAD